MKIKWWGHACFQITTREGQTILTDPYDQSVGYQPVDHEADFVTISHDHFDHNAVDLLPGSPVVVKDPEGIDQSGIKISGIPSYHDQQEGAARGKNLIFLFEIDEKRVCHLGDLGHPLTKKQIKEIGEVGVLLVPVGGTYTIDAREAFQICRQLQPQLIIPMHYKTNVLDFPITGVDEFLAYFDSEQIKKMKSPEVEVDILPAQQQVYIMDFVKN